MLCSFRVRYACDVLKNHDASAPFRVDTASTRRRNRTSQQTAVRLHPRPARPKYIWGDNVQHMLKDITFHVPDLALSSGAAGGDFGSGAARQSYVRALDTLGISAIGPFCAV